MAPGWPLLARHPSICLRPCAGDASPLTSACPAYLPFLLVVLVGAETTVYEPRYTVWKADRGQSQPFVLKMRVRQLRHYLGPLLTDFSAIRHPARAV